MKHIVWVVVFCGLGLHGLRSSAQASDTAQFVVHAAMPAFLHEGDRMEVAVHLTNNTRNELTGQVVLQLFDAANGTSVDGWFQNVFPAQYFTIESGNTAVVPFPVEVPYLFKKALAWRVTAAAQHHSGSAAGLVPVLTTKSLQAETILLPVRDTTTSFLFQNLVQSDAELQSLSIEAVSNPVWPVIRALPRLVAVQPETTETLWHRFYAYALAAYIRATSTEWKPAVEQWTKPDTSVLDSLIQTNKTAASLIRAETPWVGENASLVDKNPFLMDAVALQKEMMHCLTQLREQQKKNGSFAWINGGPEDRYTTGSVLTGMVFLKSLNALPGDFIAHINAILEPALAYLDQKLEADYKAVLKNRKGLLQDINLLQVQYLYIRRFFAAHSIPSSTVPAYRHYLQQGQQQWQKKSTLLQSMIALALHRQGGKKIPPLLTQQWKTNTAPTNVNKAGLSDPLETTAFVAEALFEITANVHARDTLIKTLINRTETDAGENPKALAHACYVLLRLPPLAPGNIAAFQVKLGDTPFFLKENDTSKIDYFRQRIYPPQLQPQSGKIELNVLSPDSKRTKQAPFLLSATLRTFGDQKAHRSSPVTIHKKLLKKKQSKAAMQQENTFKIGDTIQVQLTLSTSRALDHVYLKDVHAAGAAPITSTALHLIHWEASTHFYVPAVPKGTTVYTYSVVATRAGTFSTGIATLESSQERYVLARSNALRIQIE
jgi:hypothetical protein